MEIIEEIRELVPGFSGYREKKQRKEADKLIKNEILKKIDEISFKINKISSIISGKKFLMEIKDIEGLKDIVYGFLKKVSKTDYGNSGIFTLTRVSERQLKLIHILDLTLIKNANSLLEEVDLFEIEMKKKEIKDLNKKILCLKNSLLELEEIFDRRESLVLKK